ncbi:MAG: ferredoxin family protein [Tannerella sp.]|nr:ferredoxin family protein [Tannerella sp.]
MQNKRVTICACISRTFVDREKVAAIAVSLKMEGYDVSVEPDLCETIIRKAPEMHDIASGTIIACYPRAVRSCLDWMGLKNDRIFDIRNSSCEEILGGFDISYDAESGGRSEEEEFAAEKNNMLGGLESFPAKTGADAWNPVIDKERCTDCGKCHDFCLFGVYTMENKRVKVTNPRNCKNNCPACARMCPNRAIIFPKYEKSPINGGLVDEEIFNPEEMNRMYRERLRMRLQQRKMNVPLWKK